MHYIRTRQTYYSVFCTMSTICEKLKIQMNAEIVERIKLYVRQRTFWDSGSGRFCDYFAGKIEVGIRGLSFLGFVTSPFYERRCAFVPHGFIFVNEFRGSFPGTTGYYDGFPQGKLSSASCASFSVQCIQLFKIDDKFLPFFL